ncbi:MurR/RpiR family transcriptional regulator [Neobacillus cucumis]|uniref:MurR/RpiR family transcriptional regulator n=1 Tax=Neobacillus cucumis TaxID=1740721 RepID=UPI001962A222|nr:MurR/RpiR family transcriptional regulator [Neobacillus cucumis]MBM7656364.1 DNA-binding MurR/RpiR family transcriptional regulator [Neobacillus cucumis]MED4224774.1 MurR/RpiR family transcriptional regulator [Neobacillus cucumis]
MTSVKENNLLNTVNSLYPTLHDAEKKVAEYVIKEYFNVIDMSVAELSEQCNVSEATIVRFCKRIGLKGFHHFKITLAREINNPEKTTHSPTIHLDNLAESVQNIFAYKIDELKQTASFLEPEELQKCLDIISESSLVHFVAAGNSIPAALDGAYKFNQIGIRSIVNNTPEMQVSLAHSLTENDVVIGISNSGNSKLLLEIFEIAKKRKATTICITNHMKSPLSQLADIKLFSITNEKLFFKEFSFTIVPAISVIDTLFLLLTKKNYDRSIQSISDREQALSDFKY